MVIKLGDIDGGSGSYNISVTTYINWILTVLWGKAVKFYCICGSFHTSVFLGNLTEAALVAKWLRVVVSLSHLIIIQSSYHYVRCGVGCLKPNY